MIRMLEREGDGARTRKLFIRLDEKRAGYLSELGLDYTTLRFESPNIPIQYDNYTSDMDDFISTGSMHSLLDRLGGLDVIQEEDDQ